ncbi:MAG: cell division protein FtsZ, partial [Flavobacteriaceae bacterium]|nr:cell division protein FtsZ [Flavobacteriaceae bacterium]
TGEKRYALDDYEVMESAMNPETEAKQEEEIVFEKKTIETETDPEELEGEVDPMNTPISELLKSRAEERRQKMKNFNYKFNNSKIDDIEKVPAYKRQGLELDDRQHSSDTNISRTTLGVDENDDIQLRNNNSFLHDNVD